jgi:hypothetical protein
VILELRYRRHLNLLFDDPLRIPSETELAREFIFPEKRAPFSADNTSN